MKKSIIIVFLILIVIVLNKYFTSNYEINYKLDGYNIETIYKNKRYYVSINNKYNFDMYKKRGLSKLKIKKIEKIESENLECILPLIKDVDTYPLCYLNDEYVDYNLIDNELLSKYKKEVDSASEGNFYFNENLDKNEYIYLWNYKGFYKMNSNILETIDMFKEGKYDNSLMYQFDSEIILPNYNEEYFFKSLCLINMLSGKSNLITSNYEISYNSYIVGNIKNKIYLFDQKELKLYEINTKKLTIKLVGSEELGYFKYENNKKINVKVSEYKNKEINYKDEIISNYKYEVIEDTLYKTFNENMNLKLKIFEGKNIKIISEYNDILYFVSEDKLYKYDSINLYKIFNYFELNFNNNSIIYIYR